MRFVSLIIAMGITISATQAEARRSHRVQDANANGATAVVSHKTGARTSVSAEHVAKFQAYVDDLEAGGATIKFMGGIRRGHCSSRHMHPCGRAIDVCQLRRGVVDRSCNLPDRAAIAAIAARHGLVEGGRWRNSDYGHAQVGGYSGMAVADVGSATTMTARSHRRARRHEIAQISVAPADRLTANY